MTSTETATKPAALSATPDALGEKVFESILGTLDVFAIYIGDRLGYYRQLADHGPLTPMELAQHAGTVERYTREWLEMQAVYPREWRSEYWRLADDVPEPLRADLGAYGHLMLPEPDQTAYKARYTALLDARREWLAAQ